MKKYLILMLLCPLASYATDKHLPAPIVRTVYVEETKHDGYVVGALIGAGVTYWLMHRRAKRSRPVVVVPPTCPQPSEREQRIEAACGK